MPTDRLAAQSATIRASAQVVPAAVSPAVVGELVRSIGRGRVPRGQVGLASLAAVPSDRRRRAVVTIHFLRN